MTRRDRPCLSSLAKPAGLLALLLACSGPAAAQVADRAALESLFGEPVTTSATGKPQRASDVPVAMDIITAEQIRQSGAQDIPGVIARYTSLDVQRYGPADFSVSARGYAAPNSQRVLVLVNGRQVYLDALGRTSWDNIPVQLTEIRQIEVVRGPNTALFGFNAVGGVINILTFDPATDRVNNAVARIGTGRYGELSGVATAPLGQGGGVRVSAGLRSQHEWQVGYQPYELAAGAGRPASHGQFATDASVRLADGVQAGFDASYSRSIGDELQLPGLLLPWDIKTWSVRGRLSAETRAGLVEASLYHNALDVAYTGAPLLNQGLTVAQLSDTVKLGTSHTVRPYLEYRHNTVAAVGAPGGGLFVTSMLNGLSGGYDVAAAGGMWNWAISPTLEWTAALRYDRVWTNARGYNSPLFPFKNSDYANAYNALSWNAGLVWKPTPVDTVRASISRGIGVPSFFDYGTRVLIPGFGLGIVGNPRLRPEKADDFEAGYARRLESVDARVGLTAFYQVNTDLSASLGAFPMPTAQPGVSAIVPYNLGPSHAYGIEVSAAGRFAANWNWGVEYRLAAVDGAKPGSFQDFTRASPRNIVSARLGWGTGPWRADLFARYASVMSGYRVTQGGILPVTVTDHADVAGRLAYRLGKAATLALEGSNLLFERRRESIGLEAERRVFLSLRLDF